MTAHVFTEAEATHAREVILKLIKERRFFLSERVIFAGAPSYLKDPRIFDPAQKIEDKIRGAYSEARAKAESIITKAELELGIAMPDLSGNRQLVQCNRYGGGLDIWRVYPLSSFLKYAPSSKEELVEQCLEQLMGERSEEDISPKMLRELCRQSCTLSETIWEQLRQLCSDSSQPRCVIAMVTRFSCAGGDAKGDFMYSRVSSMQEFPQAMGYLFYMHSKNERLIRHGYAVFSTSRISHVRVEHNIGEEKMPTIVYEEDTGYDCSVIFVTIL